MSENWQKAAVKIKRMIRDASKRYPQLNPLHSFWINFARKYQVHQPDAALLEASDMVTIPVAEFDRLASTVKRQDDEIRSLEYRIATLLRS